jgi:hypothetical protein
LFNFPIQQGRKLFSEKSEKTWRKRKRKGSATFLLHLGGQPHLGHCVEEIAGVRDGTGLFSQGAQPPRLPMSCKTPGSGIKALFFFLFLTSSMENLSQLVTQEDDPCLHVLRITHHCYGLESRLDHANCNTGRCSDVMKSSFSIRNNTVRGSTTF